MTDPTILNRLETVLDELDMADQSLDQLLDHAHLSALHSTYTAAIKRIIAFNQKTITSANNLLTVLKRRLAAPNP